MTKMISPHTMAPPGESPDCRGGFGWHGHLGANGTGTPLVWMDGWMDGWMYVYLR